MHTLIDSGKKDFIYSFRYWNHRWKSYLLRLLLPGRSSPLFNFFETSVRSANAQMSVCCVLGPGPGSEDSGTRPHSSSLTKHGGSELEWT